jgi:hypothetical protein
MKHLLILTLLICGGCADVTPEENKRANELYFLGVAGIVAIDKCEYLKCIGSGSLTHKGDCKNPIHYCK